MFERAIHRALLFIGWLVLGVCFVVDGNSQSAFAQARIQTTELATTNWVSPKKLIEQIEALKEIPVATAWANDTIAIFESMDTGEISSAEFSHKLALIQQQRNQLANVNAAIWRRSRLSQAEVIEQMRVAGEITRMGYRIDRRVAVWRYMQAGWGQPEREGSGSPFSKASFSQISFDGLPSGWVEYLRLKDFKRAFGAINSDEDEQRKVSREMLARIYSPVLKPSQKKFIAESIDPAIIVFLKQHATEPVDQATLLKRIERYESEPNPLAGHYLNSDYQNLLWSNDPFKQSIAKDIDQLYRNGNFRLAVSDRLLNRLIPSLPSTQMPVSETVKGAQVSGNSHISNSLRVALEPNPNALSLRLETDGYVQSDTVARTKSFRIANQGEARFQVYQRLLIGPGGIDTSSPYSTSIGKQHVVGVESKLDNVPLVGWMARKLAANKLQDDGPETDRMFKNKVQTSAESTMQKEVSKYVDRLRYYSHTNLFQPLLAMDLEPEAVQMATSNNQVVMRYRLAGRDQMAANTARPRDSGNSLLSFQLHQSAINNAIERVGLNGEKFTIDELKMHLSELIGRPLGSTGDEDETYAEIGFSKLSPIQIDFVENRFNITLNLASLKIGEKGKTLKNVSMRASYIPTSDGMKIKLVQDDDGTRRWSRSKSRKKMSFGDKALISTVMKKLFKKEYSFNSLPQKMNSKIGGQFLEISQLVVSDGWMAVSIDDQNHAIYQGQRVQPRLGIRRIFNRR